jgi:hypothetical protein
MKTQAIILALTAAGFAQQTSNVLINTEPNFQQGGFETDLVVPFDQCGTYTLGRISLLIPKYSQLK